MKKSQAKSRKQMVDNLFKMCAITRLGLQLMRMPLNRDERRLWRADWDVRPNSLHAYLKKQYGWDAQKVDRLIEESVPKVLRGFGYYMEYRRFEAHLDYERQHGHGRNHDARKAAIARQIVSKFQKRLAAERTAKGGR